MDDSNDDDSYDAMEERRPAKRTNWRHRYDAITNKEKDESLEILDEMTKNINLFTIFIHMRRLIHRVASQATNLTVPFRSKHGRFTRVSDIDFYVSPESNF